MKETSNIMNIFSQRRFLIFVIVLFGFILRFYKLGVVPSSLEWDEVAIGYDAYSILTTGRDQFGQFLPLTFRSLDDWKPPLYEYLTVLPVKIFGLNAFSTRLPGALVGTLAIYLIYHLTQEILKYQTIVSRLKTALFASLFLAISPWHLQFSRAAFEVNIALTILLAAVLCFLLAVRFQGRWLILSSIFFGLTLFSYHSARVVSPLLFLSLLIVHHRIFQAISKRMLFTSAGIFLLLLTLFIPLIFSSQAQIRFTATNILYHRQQGIFFATGVPQERSARLRLQDEQLGDAFSGNIVHNRRLAFLDEDLVKIVMSNYFAHFQPEFLFVKGDVPLHHAPDFGMLYPWDAFFLVLGMIILFRSLISRNVLILLIWFLISPIPAAVTMQAPHSVRTELIVPTLHIFTAIGLAFVIYIFNRESQRLSRVFISLIFVVLLFNVLTYLHQYYVHLPYTVAKQWLYGREEAAHYGRDMQNKYRKIIVSTKLEQPHVFFLFYLHYPPNKYLEQGGTMSGGFLEDRNHFDIYNFRPIHFEEDRRESKFLLIGTPEEFPPDIRPLKIIKTPLGEEVIRIVET